MDDIPIVRLDDLPIGQSAEHPSERSERKLTRLDEPLDQPTAAKAKSKKKPKPPPPQFDRGGEMPEDANPDQPNKAALKPDEGLAGVDLLSDDAHSRPTSRFEEYKADGDEEPIRADTPDVPVGGEIEVVKVKRKKKKESSKKRVDA